MEYLPGSHILGTLYSHNIELLANYIPFKEYLETLIQKYQLNSLHEFYHSFPEAGYTGMICLTESHIAFHTWPEYGLLTYDVFLSNYQKDNTFKAKSIADEIELYFESYKIERQILTR